MYCHFQFLSPTAIAPSILVHPNDVSLPVNSTVSLVCIAFGAPIPSVVWSHNGSDLTGNSSHFQVEEIVFEKRGLYMAKSTIHVCGLSILFEGAYSCITDNYVGRATITTQLYLKGEPIPL